jgi:hypothetical protein
MQYIILCLGYFNNQLTHEEINILSTYMIVEWLSQQLASVENTRMKYSGSDFKFTSQASHIKQLTAMKQEYDLKALKMQRLYSRREVDEDGRMRSTMYQIMDYPSPKNRNERG